MILDCVYCCRTKHCTVFSSSSRTNKCIRVSRLAKSKYAWTLFGPDIYGNNLQQFFLCINFVISHSLADWPHRQLPHCLMAVWRVQNGFANHSLPTLGTTTALSEWTNHGYNLPINFHMFPVDFSPFFLSYRLIIHFHPSKEVFNFDDTISWRIKHFHFWYFTSHTQLRIYPKHERPTSAVACEHISYYWPNITSFK